MMMVGLLYADMRLHGSSTDDATLIYCIYSLISSCVYDMLGMGKSAASEVAEAASGGDQRKKRKGIAFMLQADPCCLKRESSAPPHRLH